MKRKIILNPAEQVKSYQRFNLAALRASFALAKLGLKAILVLVIFLSCFSQGLADYVLPDTPANRQRGVVGCTQTSSGIDCSGQGGGGYDDGGDIYIPSQPQPKFVEVENDPDKLYAEALRIYQNQIIGSYKDATEILEKAVRLRPGFLEGYLLLGRVRELRGYTTDSENAFCWAVSIDPYNAEARQGCPQTRDTDRAQAYYSESQEFIKQGSWNEAYQRLRWAVDLNRDSYFDQYIYFARKLVEAGEYAMAEEVYRNAIDRRGDLAYLHYELAEVLGKLGDDYEALSYYEEALRLYPKYMEARLSLGKAYVKLGNLEAAERLYRQAISGPLYVEAESDGYIFQERLTDVLRQQGKYTEAVAAAGELIAFYEDKTGSWDSYKSEAYRLLAGAYEGLNDEVNSRQAYKQANALGYNELASAGLNRLNERVVGRLVDGVYTEFTEWDLPVGDPAKTIASAQLQGIAESGKIAAGRIQDASRGQRRFHEASAWAGLGFDTAGLSAEPIDFNLGLGAEDIADKDIEEVEIPPGLEDEPIIIELMEKGKAAKQEFEEVRINLANLEQEVKEEPAPQKQAELVELKEQCRKAENKKAFYSFTVQDKIRELKRKREREEQGQPDADD